MPEFIVGFIVGLGWWLIVPLCILALLVEHNERHGWTTLFTLILAVVLYYSWGLSLAQFGYGMLAYLPIGFAWSFWRWKRRCSKVKREVNEYEKFGDYEAERLRRQVNVQNNTDTIVYWVIGWPFSLIESLLGDIIDVIERSVRGMARYTYQRWADDADQAINDRIQKENDGKTPPKFR